MKITGQVEDIIYKNENNGYTIATFLTEEEELITVVGYLPFIQCGDSLKLMGNMVNHIEYGEQFKIDTFEKIMPQSEAALEKYLANGIIKGIGPSIAKKIVKTFGEDTLHVLKYEPKKLAVIKGITEEKAIHISEEFNLNWEMWNLVSYLEQFGISATSTKTVYDKLGENAKMQIEENPYVLVDILPNVDFKQIDKVAMELGFTLDNTKRIKSAIKYGLHQISYNGHCCTLYENLVAFEVSLLGVSEEEIEEAIIDLKVTGDIVLQDREEENEEWVYLSSFFEAEQAVAEKLLRLKESENRKKIPNFEKEIKKAEKLQNITLSEEQKEAVHAVNENNVTIITGGPGTGKTTIIKTIIEIYKAHGLKPVLCAPTGRAAKRMTEATGEEAKTLHRLLEIGKLQEDILLRNDVQVAPIDADIIIVDEASMMDIFLTSYLMKAIYQTTKLVLVGDVDQLPSVGPGNVLKDIMESESITTVVLNKIFRQAAQSKIIVNAHRVNEGKTFLVKGEEEASSQNDFFYIASRNQEDILQQILSLCKGRLQNYGNYDFFHHIQVLSPTKKGRLGTKSLNEELQKALNQKVEGMPERQNSGYTYRKGDRIMQVKNNYDIFWKRQTEKAYETGTGVFNGELGTILKIDEENKQVKIQYDDEKIAWYDFAELDQIELAYSITIHKAQGSEFDVVILPIFPSSPMLLTRNLLYTGITRAKKLLIVVGYDTVITSMIHNNEIKKRNTGLAYMLEKGEV